MPTIEDDYSSLHPILLYAQKGIDYNKLKNSLSSKIDFAGDLNSSSEMKLHLATVLIKKVLSKLEN